MNPNGSIEEFLSHSRIAVVGVSRQPEKYGYKIYFDLKQKGYEVYAVNPRVSEIDGDRCYPDLSSLPVKVEVVNLVVPPEVGRTVVEECLRLEIERVWFQPGAESPDLLDYCQSQGLKVVHGQCVMIRSRVR